MLPIVPHRERPPSWNAVSRSRRVAGRLRHRHVDDLGAERRDQVGRGEVEVDAVRPAADGDRVAIRRADASTITGHARLDPNGVIAPRS